MSVRHQPFVVGFTENQRHIPRQKQGFIAIIVLPIGGKVRNKQDFIPAEYPCGFVMVFLSADFSRSAVIDALKMGTHRFTANKKVLGKRINIGDIFGQCIYIGGRIALAPLLLYLLFKINECLNILWSHNIIPVF